MRMLMFLTATSLLLAGPAAAQCWTCDFDIMTMTTWCSDHAFEGRVDCDQNMSQTWCSVERYENCWDQDLQVFATGAVLGGKEPGPVRIGLDRQMDAATAGLGSSPTLAPVQSEQRVWRTCDGFVVRPVRGILKTAGVRSAAVWVGS